MEIAIELKPNAKTTEIIEQSDNYLKIRVNAPASDGKANKALIDFLAKHFKIGKSRITIIKGLTSRRKLVRITTT